MNSADNKFSDSSINGAPDSGMVRGYEFSRQQKATFRSLAGRALIGASRLVLEITGPLDPAKWKGGVEQIIARHEILRTRVRPVGGMAFPLQQIGETWGDWHTENRGDATVEEVLADVEGWKDLPPAGAPVRATLIQLSADRWVFVLLVRALLVDRGSLLRIAGELTAEHLGRTSPDEPAQYMDVVQWQEGEAAANGAEIPGKARPEFLQAFVSGAGNSEGSPPAPARFFRTISGFCGRVKASYPDLRPESVALAAWRQLLVAMEGDSAAAQGVTLDSRVLAEIADTLGPLEIRVPFEQETRPGLELREIVARIQDRLDSLQKEALGQIRAVSPESPTSFFFAESPLAPAVRIRSLEDAADSAAVQLSCLTDGQDLGCEFRIDASRFPLAVAEAFAERYGHLLEQFLGDPERRAADLSLVGESERARLTGSFAGDSSDPGAAKTLDDCFREQVALRGGNFAVVCGEQRLTFCELDGFADRVAAALRADGVGAGDVIAIALPRGVDYVASMLGVLRAGATFLPIDPEYPREYVDRILNLGAAKGWIGSAGKSFAAGLRKYDVRHLPEAKPGRAALAAESPAYVMFTSGSTSEAKGVVVRQSSLINLYRGLEKLVSPLGEGGAKVVAVNASFSFDASMKQVVAMIVGGHTLDILPEDVRQDGEQVVQYFQQHAVDVVDTTPGQLELWLQAGLVEKMAGRRMHVLVGGDKIEPSLWAALRGQDTVAFYNVYGPTECTVDATGTAIEGGAPLPHAGRPLPNSFVYLLDDRLQPVPLGARGKIYVGGAGVALGYRNRPALTAAAFVPNPFRSGERIFATGDLGVFNAGGTLRILGRGDGQLKIRGMRVEPSEIEEVLSRHPGVKHAVVLPAKVGQGMELIACVIPNPSAEAAGDGSAPLETCLRENLPAQMVPYQVVMFSQFPLLPNAKIDRVALAGEAGEIIRCQRHYVAPETDLEREIERLWAGEFERSQVGVTEDFFQLGGHSLMAARIVLHVRKKYEVELRLADFYEKATIRGLAELIQSAGPDPEAEIPSVDRDSVLC